MAQAVSKRATCCERCWLSLPGPLSRQHQEGGLSGKRSSLFWELFRICLHRCAENVQRMPPNDEWIISNNLRILALAVCASLLYWTNRPRLFELDWMGQGGDVLWVEDFKKKDGWRLKLTGSADLRASPRMDPRRETMGRRCRGPSAGGDNFYALEAEAEPPSPGARRGGLHSSRVAGVG